MRTRNSWWLVALVAVFGLVLAACPADDGPTDDGDGAAADGLDLVSEGRLTVCTDAPYPPMEFEDPETGEMTGFDIELMRAVGEELGLEVAVINSGFDPITSGQVFEAGQCDIAAASITITEDRQESVAFSDPYFTADQSLLVKADAGITTLDDVAGERLGVQAGTTGEMYARDNAPDDTEIVSFDDPGDLFVALEADDIVGVLQDIVVNQGRALEEDTLEVVETYPTDEEYGFAMRMDNEELVQAVNDALGTLRDDGTYDELHEEWFDGGS